MNVIRESLIFYNMMFEDLFPYKSEYQGLLEQTEEIVVQPEDSAQATWASFLCSWMYVLGAPHATLASIRELYSFLKNIDEYNKTLCLVMDHLGYRKEEL